MKEIVHLQAGQCGNNVGGKVWKAICDEHGIDPNGIYCGDTNLQLERINVYYNETSTGSYIPRAVLIDLEPGIMDSIRSGSFGVTFSQDNFVHGQDGAAYNWAKGYYTEGMEVIDAVLDIVRKETENCDCLQGFQLTHSLGGGTGSGLGTRLLDRLGEEYPDRIRCNYCITSSPSVSLTLVEAYNNILSLNMLVTGVDYSFWIDNEALYNICFEKLKMSRPTLRDLNHLISTAVAGITSTLRFPCQVNSDLRIVAMNMVPEPRLHFFIPGFAPIIPREAEEQHETVKIPELIKQLFGTENILATCDPRHGLSVSASVQFRGEISTKEIMEEMSTIKSIYHHNFIEWIPNNIKTAVCDISSHGTTSTGTLTANNTAVVKCFKQALDAFRMLLKRKAFLHFYLAEGMDETEFRDVDENVNRLINEIIEKQEFVADEIEDDEQDDEDEYDDDEEDDDDDIGIE